MLLNISLLKPINLLVAATRFRYHRLQEAILIQTAAGISQQQIILQVAHPLSRIQFRIQLQGIAIRLHMPAHRASQSRNSAHYQTLLLSESLEGQMLVHFS